LFFVATAALAQHAPPVRDESPSTVEISSAGDGSQTVAIRNTTYQATAELLLRKTTRSKQVLGDIGMEASVALEVWRLGDDPRGKPLYTLTVEGAEGRVVDNALFVVSRGLEETEWWSVYQLGSGRRLFDTYVPLLSFSISRAALTTRYAGLEVPPDDTPDNTKDARLKRPNVVAALRYASADRVIREVLVICDDTEKAKLLRSYSDTTRTLAWGEGTLQLSFSRNYPSQPDTVEIRIPVRRDDLDLAHSRLPPGLHLSP